MNTPAKLVANRQNALDARTPSTLDGCPLR